MEKRWIKQTASDAYLVGMPGSKQLFLLQRGFGEDEFVREFLQVSNRFVARYVCLEVGIRFFLFVRFYLQI